MTHRMARHYRHPVTSAIHLTSFKVSTRVKTVRTNRLLGSIAVTIAMFGAACSREDKPPQQLAKIPSSAAPQLAGVVSLHVPGSILDSYITFDVTSGSKSFSPLSVAACEWIAAKISPEALDVVLYQGAASLRSASSGDTGSATVISLLLKNIDRSATNDD